jgi:hypothetical protein
MLWKIGALLSVLAFFSATIIIGSGLSQARSPQINKASADGIGPSSFSVNGKATGLAGGFTYEVTVIGGSVTANVDCINPGSNNVQAQATTAAAAAGTTGPVVATQNGNLNFGFTGTLSIGSNPCPNPNWTPVITSYSGTVTIGLFDFSTGALLDSQTLAISFP